VLVDQSGSLIYNDPEDFRKDALRFFLGELRENDKVALLSFGNRVHEYKNDNQNFLPCKENIEFLFHRISSLTRNDGITDLRMGLRKILQIVESGAYKDKIKLLIFTDAQLKTGDLPRGVMLNAYLNDIYQIGVQLREKDVVIYGLAFTRNANLAYLQKLAGITGGDAIHAYSPEVANQAILKLINPIIEGPFDRGEKIPVVVTDDIKSFTVYAFNDKLSVKLPQIKIYNPENEEVTAQTINKYKTSVSSEVMNPKPGVWTAYVEGASGVKIYYSKKVNYNLQIYSPRTTDLSVCSGSQLPINFDVNNISAETIGKSDAVIILWNDLKTNKLKSISLNRSGFNYTGQVDLNYPPGIYNMEMLIRLPNETIKRNFVVNVEKCVDFQCLVQSDIVLNHPVIVQAIAPIQIDQYKMFITLQYPDKKAEIIEMFDNGDPKNGDALANDGNYSNILRGLKEPGRYNVEFSLEYTSNGIPVINRKNVNFSKLVSIKPDIVQYKFPRKKEWTVENKINITNKSSYEIVINAVAIEDRGLPLDIQIVNSPIVVKGNSTSSINLLYHYLSSEQVNEVMEYSIVLGGYAENLAETPGIKLQHQSSQQVSVAEKLLWLLIVMTIFVLVLIFIGIFIVIPVRFNKKFVQIPHGDPAYLSGYERQNFRTAVYIPENESFYGILLLGWGQWYKKQGREIVKGRREAEILVKI